jgi:hypothetical protein
LEEVKKSTIDEQDALEKSSFFKLHHFYRNNNIPEVESFNDFLFYINTLNENQRINGFIFLEDIELLTVQTICDFLQFQIGFVIYKKAIIYGERFTARGYEYIETKESKQFVNNNYGQQERLYEMNNPKNDLSNFENWSSQYSTWCKYHQNNKNIGYGQVNYFFRFYCKTDRILHGLPIANLVPRNYLSAFSNTNSTGVDKILCKSQFKKYNRNYFVPLTNFFPSAILIAPFDIGNLPIYIKEDSVTQDQMEFYSKNNQISYFLAFELHPNKKYSIFDRMKIERYNRFTEDELVALVEISNLEITN